MDLNPAGASSSSATGNFGGQQVGAATVGGQGHAGLWNGTAASWVDLHPTGASDSAVNGVFGEQQVGYATVGGASHAGVWSGSAASWVDLHAFVPAGFSSSIAKSIWTDAIFTYVAGFGFNTVTHRNEALLWTQAVADADGDGLPDDWETNGIPYTDAAGVARRYLLPGANPLRKDIYVEVDSMDGRAPSQAAIDRVIAAFNAAPVPAGPGVPGGQSGIALHVLMDEPNLQRRPYPHDFGEFQIDKSVHFGTHVERDDDVNWPMVRKAKAKAYRYCIFGDTHGSGSSSGLAETPGNDFMVTLGLWPPPAGGGGTEQQQAGTFMHELGHTLGLQHGGAQDDPDRDPRYNYKPNYFSVMNYLWQTPSQWMRSGVGPGQWEDYFPNYSAAELPPLNEASLNELVGIRGGIPTVRVPYGIPAGTINCDTQVACVAGPACIRYAAFNGPVDWDNDCNANSQATGALDINYIRNGASPGDILNGFNDWSHLIYNFKGVPEFADGMAATGGPVEIDIPTFLYLNSFPPPCFANFNGVGGLNVQDIFDFLAAWFAHDPRADFNGVGGITTQDIFDFLAAWFAGCP